MISTRSWLKVAALGAAVLLVGTGVAVAAPSPARDPIHVQLAQVRPRLDHTRMDFPWVRNRPCNVRWGHRVRLCRVGDRDAKPVVVAFGDSHMVQWFAPLRVAAHRDHFRLVWGSMPGCPAAAIRTSDGWGADTECMKWRHELFQRIRGLRRVDVVVMSSSSWHPLLVPGTTVIAGTGAQRQALWRKGMVRSVKAVLPKARRVLVIRDTPHLAVDPAQCLQSTGGDTRPCSRARSQAMLPGIWSVEKSLEQRFDRVDAVQFTSDFCTDTICRPVSHGLVLRYRDDNHMSNTFAKCLLKPMTAVMGRVLRRAERG